MGETFTHYARRVIARLDRDRLTVKQAGAEVRPLRENPDMQAVRDQALRDAAYRIRAEWVCCTTEDEGPDPARWPHECCRYSEYAAGNTEDLLGTPHGFDVTRYYDLIEGPELAARAVTTCAEGNGMTATEHAKVLRRKVWYYRPGGYSQWRPLTIGSDELGRRTAVIGTPLTGHLVVVTSKPGATCGPECDPSYDWEQS